MNCPINGQHDQRRQLETCLLLVCPISSSASLGAPAVTEKRVGRLLRQLFARRLPGLFFSRAVPAAFSHASRHGDHEQQRCGVNGDGVGQRQADSSISGHGSRPRPAEQKKAANGLNRRRRLEQISSMNRPETEARKDQKRVRTPVVSSSWLVAPNVEPTV